MHQNETCYSAVISSPIGKLGMTCKANKVTGIQFLGDDRLISHPQDEITQQLVDELTSYFKNPNHRFSISYDLIGTAFQLKVWRALLNIPMGKTMSYGALANACGTSPRAIGQACRTNPIPIIIPCHRVTAMHDIGGFSGEVSGNKISMKAWLLAHERELLSGSR